MAKKKKLKVGDIVSACFLGTPERCEVIQVTYQPEHYGYF